MELGRVSDDYHPNRHHLTLDSIPHIDLGLLSQSDLYSLSLTSSSACSSSHPTPRCDEDVLIPKIDRSVFNESAGSRKQTYSRLRLAPRDSQFQIPKPKLKTEIPTSQPRDRETLQIITLLKQLFPSDNYPDDNDGSVAAPEPLEQNVLVNLSFDAEGSQRKRKRGRPRRDSYVDVSVQNPGGGNTSTAIVVHGSDGTRKRGRRPKDENGVDPVSAEKSKASVKEARVKAEELEPDMMMVNRNGVVVDLEALANADDLFSEALRRRTVGMGTVAQLLGFLGGLEGDWSSTRKKRKIVQASEFCDALPRYWKITLSLKRGGGRVWLFCRRYISPNGQQFVSCKEVSSYLISYFEAASQSKLGHTDGNVDVSNIMASGDDKNLAAKDENEADELVSCSIVLNTSASTGPEKPETLFHTENPLEIQAGDAIGMWPNGSEQVMKAEKDGKDLGLDEQGSEFSLTNDMLGKVEEATGAGPSSGVHLVYQRDSNNQKKRRWEYSGEASVVNCFRDGVNDGATASVSSVDVPVDSGTALTGMGNERRTDNTDNSQLTSIAENTKLDVNYSGDGRLLSGIRESCIGAEDAYTDVKRQSTSEACSLVPSVVKQYPEERDSQRGLCMTFIDDKTFDESNNFVIESFRTSYEPEFDDIGLSGNNDKTISFGSDHATPDVDEHVISTGSFSDVPALGRQSCITLSDAKYPNCSVEELWKQKGFQRNVSNPFVKMARGTSETAMLFPSGYAQSYNMVNNVNTSSSSMKESQKEEVKRSWNSEAFHARCHSGIGANHITSAALQDNPIRGSVSIRPNGSEKTPLFDNTLCRDYSDIMWQQPNSEVPEKSGNIEPTTGFVNDSQSRDPMEELMWRMDEQSAQQTRVADTSSALVQSSGCYPHFDMFSGQGGNGSVSLNENFDSMSSLEGLKPGRIRWLDKESLPSMANIARSCDLKNCSWCGNEFYHEVYEAGTQTGSVGIMCPTCQAKFSSEYNSL